MIITVDDLRASLAAVCETAIRPADLLPELSWDAPAGADLAGYNMADYFDLDMHAVYATREHAIQALRDAYKGADEHGVGIFLPITAELARRSMRHVYGRGSY